MSDPNDSTSTSDGVSCSSAFLEFCGKVRNNDPSILPEPGDYFKILRTVCEKENIELAAALQKNSSVTYLLLRTDNYTKDSAEAMSKYVRTSKSLQRIDWYGEYGVLQQLEEMLCCFLPAIQESTSLKELHMRFPRGGGLSDLALENMLTHTQSLRSLTLLSEGHQLVGRAIVAAASSGLKNNTTLRELTLDFSPATPTLSLILTSLCDHPHLRRLCLRGHVGDLTGLDTLLLSDTSKITELDIRRIMGGPPMTGLARALIALGRRPTLTKLMLHGARVSSDEARLLLNIPSLQSLVLTGGTLEYVGLAEIAPALYHNTSIKVLNISKNGRLDGTWCARLLRDIFCRNKTMTTLDLSGYKFGGWVGAVECIADGLGSNSALLKIDLSRCALRDGGVSTLARSLGSRNTTVQKLKLAANAITSTGVGVLLDTICHIRDLDLQGNPIGHEGASLLARSLRNNALPNLTRLSLYNCGIGDDGFIALVSALEQNTSLLQLDLRSNYHFNERAFLALAESLPEIEVLQQINLIWCTGLASAMPLLLAGLRKNTSLFRFHVTGCAASSVPPTTEETARCAGGWMQEMERLGYRNHFLPLIRRAPKERLPPRGVWPHALARVATLTNVIFEVLRSKPNLVPSEDTEGKEAAKDTGKRKRGDE